MKRSIIFVIILLLISTLLSEPIKVAIGNLDKKDRDSGYIVNRLTKSDFKKLFKVNEKYELLDINDTQKAIKKAASKEFIYLGKEEKLALGKELGAGILIWGDITSMGSGKYKFVANILSMETEEFIQTSIEITKKTDERIAALQEKLISELDNSCESSSQIVLEIALQQFGTRDFDQAEQSFLAVLGSDPNNVKAHFYMGAIKYINRNYEESLRYFLTAKSLDPDNDDILNQLSKVYTKLEMYEEAIDALRGISDYEENPDIWMQIAALYRSIEYYTEAQESYETVISITDTIDNAYLELSDLLYELEYYEEALPYLEEASKRFPEDDFLAKKLATSYKKTGKIEDAIQQYKDLIATNSENLKAYYNLANAYTSVNDYDKALETALKLKAKDPDNPNVYILLSDSYSSLKDYGKAETAAKKVLELDENNYQAYRILSEIYQGRGYIKYEQYLDNDEKSKGLYGTEADEMIEKRDKAKQEAYDLFIVSQNYLNEAKNRTSLASELGYIKERGKTLKQLLEQTKKSFF